MKKDIKKLIFMSVIVIFTVGQLIFFLYNNSLKSNLESRKVTREEESTKIKFAIINEELKTIDNSSIYDVNNSGGKWKVKILLVGNKDEILDSLNKLNNMEKYTINEYNIDGKKGCFAVKLDLNRRN